MEKNGPEKKFKAGPVSATIWKNEVKNKDGEKGAYYSVTIDRSYKDKSDKWQTTNSLRINDLPRAGLVLDKAFEYLTLKEYGHTDDDEVVI
jgi:hypothetical protein